MPRANLNPVRTQAYFEWLCDTVAINEPDNSYFLLAKKLDFMPFLYTIPMDANRAKDGTDLRGQFESKTNYKAMYCDDTPCTMLEMLVALAVRINDIMYEDDNHDKTAVWFWEMMTNVGLDIFTDADYFKAGGDSAVEKIVDRIIERKYKKNGKGGLFPLSGCYKNEMSDQRKVQIWYQMQTYLIEKYPVL